MIIAQEVKFKVQGCFNRSISYTTYKLNKLLYTFTSPHTTKSTFKTLNVCYKDTCDYYKIVDKLIQ